MPNRRGFFEALFDLSFTDLITTKIVKVLYVIAMAGVGLATLLFIIGSFADKVGYGILALLFSPLIILVGIIIARLYAEMTIILFRIAEYVRDISEKVPKE
jgi:hypothetical protein